jgi:heat-inducible transcriptional repressor
MEIATRKQQILAAVIENYIETGEPIGSKSLQNTEGLNVSSATIRNELSDLTSLGFLMQPHTSAGRIPTEAGWRYYVDNLLKVREPDERVKRYIDSRLRACDDAPEHILESCAAVISELLGTAAAATTPKGENTRVHKIRFVPTGRYTSMLVLITSAGMIKSRLFRCDFAITPEMLNVFDRALNEQLAGVRLEYVNKAFAQTFAASFGELGLLMPDMLMAAIDACKDAMSTNVYTAGETKLLYQSDLITARNVLEFLGDKNESGKLFESMPEGTNIYIGKENTSPLLRHSAMAAVRYNIDNRPAGILGVIGSMRMNYPAVVSILEYTAKSAGEMITELIAG